MIEAPQSEYTAFIWMAASSGCMKREELRGNVCGRRSGSRRYRYVGKLVIDLAVTSLVCADCDDDIVQPCVRR